jgi:hypothetical protein
VGGGHCSYQLSCPDQGQPFSNQVWPPSALCIKENWEIRIRERWLAAAALSKPLTHTHTLAPLTFSQEQLLIKHSTAALGRTITTTRLYSWWCSLKKRRWQGLVNKDLKTKVKIHLLIVVVQILSLMILRSSNQSNNGTRACLLKIEPFLAQGHTYLL